MPGTSPSSVHPRAGLITPTSIEPSFGAHRLGAQTVKNLPAVQTEIRSLCREDPLEKETATHSSIHAWQIPRTEEPGGLQSLGSQRVGYN